MKRHDSFTANKAAQQSFSTACYLVAALLVSASSCLNGAEKSEAASPYAEARAKFKTHLIKQGPAPQNYSAISPPSDAREVSYSSGGLKLKAWVSVPPPDGMPHPAVIFLHGGFSFGEGDWKMSQPYRDAGFVVLTPMLRGENGLPGDYSMFFFELDDVLAAAEVLAALPYVRSDRVYVAGHSAGGTLALLVSMYSNRFRAAASFSGSPDQKAWSLPQPKIIPFESTNLEEFKIRSPLAYATSFQCPVRVYHGSEEAFFAATSAKLAALAQGKMLDVQDEILTGNHTSYVPEAIRKSIAFFRSREK